MSDLEYRVIWHGEMMMSPQMIKYSRIIKGSDYISAEFTEAEKMQILAAYYEAKYCQSANPILWLPMIVALLIACMMLACSPAPAESIPPSSATFASNVEQIVKPPATPKGDLPTTEVKPLSLENLQHQVQAIENLQKAQWALALIDTYSNACGRRFDEGDDYTGCVNEAIKCAFKSMENGNVSFDALRRCGEGME